MVTGVVESVGTVLPTLSPNNSAKRQKLKAVAQGIEIKHEDNDKRRRIDAAIADYLSEVRLTKKLQDRQRVHWLTRLLHKVLHQILP